MSDDVLFEVTDKNGELNSTKLTKLVTDSGIGGSLKDEILEAKSAGELEVVLKEEADSAIEPMFNVIEE